MSLRSADFLQHVNDQPMQYNGGPGWQQISAGLQLVSVGYCVLLLGSAAGTVFVWLALSGPTAGDGPSERNPFPLMAAATLFLTALFSYGLVLAGQWRCLMYAPQRHSAKELMYICFHCLLVGSLLSAIGAWLDGGKTYAALQQGWAGLQGLDFWSAGNLMQVGSVLMGVLGSLVFSQFLRNVADCFSDRRGARAVDLNLWFMGLMIGGSVGALFFVRALTLKGDTLPWLVSGWLLCFAWHLWLVLRVRRCVADGLRRVAVQWAPPVPAAGVGAVLTHTLSGLRRIARNASA